MDRQTALFIVILLGIILGIALAGRYLDTKNMQDILYVMRRQNEVLESMSKSNTAVLDLITGGDSWKYVQDSSTITGSHK